LNLSTFLIKPPQQRPKDRAEADPCCDPLSTDNGISRAALDALSPRRWS
jgi:hypothetical protein